MGTRTCQFGVVHGVCRCTTPHTIECDKPEEHKDNNYVPKHRKEDSVKTKGASVSRNRSR